MKHRRIVAFLAALAMAATVAACGAGQEIPAPTEANGQEVTEQVPEETWVEPVPTEPSAAEALLGGMTLREKIGQMFMVAARTWTDAGESVQCVRLHEEQAEAITELNLSGVCLFSQNIADTRQTLELTEQIQQAAFASSVGVGALISIDQEGGYITRLTTGTSGIGNMAIGATGDRKLATEAAELIARELDALGINVDFAPDADVNCNPENPVIGVRSFSDDPRTVAECAGAFLTGLDRYNITGCLKHFPGHGDTGTDSHTGLPLVDKSYEEIRGSSLIPFAENCAQSPMVMTAHIQFPQIEQSTYVSVSTGEEVYLPATMSRTIITGILRNDLGFDGVVVTDALEMGAIRNHFDLYDAVRMIINADVDLLLMPFDLNSPENIEAMRNLIDEIVRMVESGGIPESEIDNSVARILRLKEGMGLFHREERDLEERIVGAMSVVGSQLHHDLEWDMACKAVTVYKNDGAFPLTEEEKSSVLYLTAWKSQMLSAEFAKRKLEEAGFDIAGLNITALTYDGGAQTLESVRSYLRNAKVLILTTCTGALKQADPSNPANTGAVFCHGVLEEAKRQGKKVIVLSTMLPYDAPYYGEADGVLLCYNPSGMTALPQADRGSTIKYGPNLPAALYTVLR